MLKGVISFACLKRIAPLVSDARLVVSPQAERVASMSDSDSETHEFEQPPSQFDDEVGNVGGSVATLSRKNQVAGPFVPPRFFDCAQGTRLYLAVLDEKVAGGETRKGKVVPEKLCVLLLENEPDFFPKEKFGRDHSVPVQLFWLSVDGRLRRAPLLRRGDNEESLTFTAYKEGGEQVLPLLHRVLGFTFLCPHKVWTEVWQTPSRPDGLDRLSGRAEAFDVNHKDTNHGNNALSNLEVLRAKGKGGHRQLSGRLAKRTKR